MPHIELPQAEFKVVLLGNSSCGKTSLVLRFVEGHYRENRSATVGAFFLTKRLTLDSMTCKLLLWDTAGQEQFQRLAVTYYKQAAAAIVCYDISGQVQEQIAGLQRWLDQVQHNISNQSDNRIVLVVAACKSDLPATAGIEDEAKHLAERYGALYIKTSAKNDNNVSEVFTRTAETVLQCQHEAATGRGRPIPVTVGGMSLRNSNRSFSPTNQSTPIGAAGSSFRNSNAANSNNLTSQKSQSISDAKGGDNANRDDSETAADSDDNLDEHGLLAEESSARRIMCDNGLLVCGEGNGSECCIL